jgi:hypothetical protein
MLIESDKFDTLEDKELLNYALNNATLIDKINHYSLRFNKKKDVL